ncbi:DEAD/DEAH box helicase [Ruania alba]|uniref:Predicted helicase n=1 Tax=Ruania alba TaxID=648782 RepID=A0A1H5GZF0_9MICO|nr:type ISP restriction/modification enzyme [Ruania alba]SEE20884.1 Predicted helicase [Ruania alba]
MKTVADLLDKLYYASTSEADKGARFERLTQAFLRADVSWADRFADVWLWTEWPGNGGRRDAGIDLVARERESDELVAIQCKFYDPQTRLTKAHIDSFLSESGKDPFARRIVVSTALEWGPNAEAAIHEQTKPVSRMGLSDFIESSIDWEQFSFETPELLEQKERKQLRPHQRKALEEVRDGFTASGRGKLVMACGTGKTFTALKIAEDQVPLGGRVLFLVPSIALLSQTLTEWSMEAAESLRTFAVCSDGKVGRGGARAGEDVSVVDLPIPATTDPVKLAAAASDPDRESGRLTVVLATYQSIDVVHQAQQQGLGEFDLVICDEAHRTTGATLAGQEESAFVRVHNADYIRAAKRLYMTATPRIYGDASKTKAGQEQVVLASMDDEDLFGPEFHRLGFGEAVELNLLTDYRVLVLAVDEGAVSRTFQGDFSAHGELNLDDAARIVGCWNGLDKRGNTDGDFASDPEPMRRAVAFARDIKSSRAFSELFASVTSDYARLSGVGDDGDRDPLSAGVRHVDGSMNIMQRTAALDWLKEPAGEDEARVLSNARCLSEGVDVPALDAVMFLNPRKSEVDVVQSVGRVMRRAPGKRYGYIILPIGIPAGVSPEEALADNDRYRVVWEVLQALRAHDERFESMINKIDLNTGRDDRIQIIGVGGDDEDLEGDSASPDRGAQGVFDLASLGEYQDALYAKIVRKVGSRRYWEDWAKDVADIAERHRTRLLDIIATGHAAEEFAEFHTALRHNLNEGISREDAVQMLSQHLITKPVFDALFTDYDFAANNPVSRVMQTMLETLEGAQLESETESLEGFYESVRARAAGIDNAQGKQRIIADLYERFFSLAFPKAADALGIVYTPVEVVDFILRSVDHLSRAHFGKGLTDEGVHVLDPFTGTGTFLTRLIGSGLISPHDLARKYVGELHANEIMLLAYYIAAINIETTYHQARRDHAGNENEPTAETAPVVPGEPFGGIVLTDTFQMTEDDELDDQAVFTTNNDRVSAQRRLDIRVIVGNPPYSKGQTSGNDNNANLKYPSLDRAIEETFAARSRATNKNSLYDSYVRAIRWALTRIGDAGVIGFVTNGGFIDANTADGLRQTLAEECTDIYVYNLRGNQRTSGEQSRKEGGKIFGSGSRNTVAVTFLVKDPTNTAGKATIRYRDVGDYLTREQKLDTVAKSTIEQLDWQDITPNDAGDWINQRTDAFDTYQPLGDRTGTPIFATYSRGLSSGRDAWVYNASTEKLTANVSRMVDFYNTEVDRFEQFVDEHRIADPKKHVGDFINNDPTRFSWNRADRTQLARGRRYEVRPERQYVGLYRPFTKQAAWFDAELNDMVYRMPSMFPTPNHPNYGFVVVAPGSDKQFSTLAVGTVPDLSFWGSGPSQFFARYTYERVDDGTLELDADVIDGYRRIDNITDVTLATYRRWYGNDVTKDEIFAFVYGLLHSTDYRERFAADLKRSLPHIPRIAADDFAPFADAGQRLLDLHINYASAEPYPLTVTGEPACLAGETTEEAFDAYRVRKLTYAGSVRNKDRSVIVYSPTITVTGIPEDAHQYVLGTRTALDWILDRYQIRTDKSSGIVNDPNDWAREVGNPRYILDLIAQVTAVSVETVHLVGSLPPLRLVNQS